MLTTDRAVLIRYMRDGKLRRGSGLQVAGRFVLTADHCADGTGHTVVVSGAEHAARVFVRSSSADVDVAVLEVPSLPVVEPLRCVALDPKVPREVADCRALGFPVWKDGGGGPRLAQVPASVPTAEGLDPWANADVVPLMSLKITNPDIREWRVLKGDLDQAGSPWAGMSGAVVVTADDHVVGVVRAHSPAEGVGSLTATRLEAITCLPEDVVRRFLACLHVPDPRSWPKLPLLTGGKAPIPASLEQVVVGQIPQEPPAFVARDMQMQLAYAAGRGKVKVTVIYAVTGLRGVGKTQIAAAYARARVSDGWGLVGWVNAEARDALLTDLARIAECLGVGDPQGDSLESARRLQEHLQTRPGDSLLVFDNATDPDHLRPFLPAIGRTQVVLTTTDRAFTEFGQSVDVAEFSRLESLDYLAARTGLADMVGADAVAKELGDLPLGLAQAAATIRRQRLTYPKYLERLRRIPVQDLLKRTPGEDYPRPTAAALIMSIQAAEASDPTGLTSTVLRVIAALSPHGVHRDILNGLVVKGSGGDEEDVDAAIERCTAGSLLTWSVNGDSVIMHRLLGRVLRERDQADGQWAETVAAALNLLEPRLIPGEQAWAQREEGEHLVAQVEALWEADLDAGNGSPDLCLRILRARAWIVRQLRAAADSSGAIARGLRALDDYRRILGTEHPETLTLRISLAESYRSSGRLGEAIALSEQTLAECEQVLGTDHPETLRSRNELAKACRSSGRLGEAIVLSEQTLADRERVLGADHPDTLVSRSNLGFAYRMAGRLGEAIVLYQQTLADRERVLGADHPDTLVSRSNLAFAYQVAGRLNEAIALAEQTLADRQRILGADHPDTLLSQHNLAGVHQAAGRLDEAIVLYQQALADRERVLGADHPSTLTTRNTLAGAYRSAGRPGEAIVLYQRTLAGRERVLSADHPQILRSRNNLAGAYQAAGRLDEAIALYQQTLADQERVLGADHRQVLTTRNNLAGAYQAARLDEAIALYQQSLADQERVLDVDHPQILRSRNNLAGAYQAAGRLDEAIALYQQTLADRERVLGSDHPDTLTTRNGLECARTKRSPH